MYYLDKESISSGIYILVECKHKVEECHFLRNKIDFLGHLIENGKIWPGQGTIGAVKNFPIPKNVNAVHF